MDLAPGVPVGVASSACRPASEVTVEPGGVRCAYTDGLVERRGSSPGVGLERLVEVVSTGADTADGLCARIMAGLVGGRPADDDVALPVIRRDPVVA
ncbi:hypothetical protein GCM10009836_72510 [Pseudonocardia ailaonensis]|uniref:PPM-type phosphatase domain-containing protein n=1 Tax=Pseudonocardia ailaonensis TaxID=367279 RepID=A0ABN2NPL3_9PSEU